MAHEQGCVCGRLDCDTFNRNFHQMLMDSGLAENLGLVRYREMPRYRYWQIKRGKGTSRRTFEYTTEKSLGYGGKEPERYWAIERRWVRTKGGETGKVVRTVGFATRKKAKERALQWYEKARTPAVTAE